MLLKFKNEKVMQMGYIVMKSGAESSGSKRENRTNAINLRVKWIW